MYLKNEDCFKKSWVMVEPMEGRRVKGDLAQHYIIMIDTFC